MEDKGAFRGKTYEALRDRLQYSVERLSPLKGKDLVDFIAETISRVDNRNIGQLIETKAITFLDHQNKELQPRLVNVILSKAFQLAAEKKHLPIDERLMNEALIQTGVKQTTFGKVA